MADASYMGFVGVTTSSSSMMKIFPAWAEVLGLPTRTLIGHDIPLDSSPDTYRSVIRAIRDDPHHLGALVTTHKMAVFKSALDLFDSVDDLARTFGEISSVAKRDTRLIGAAKDPLTVRLALEEFIPPDHFTTTSGGALINWRNDSTPRASSSALPCPPPRLTTNATFTNEPASIPPRSGT
jgi:shikimate 5-dehydrogenase